MTIDSDHRLASRVPCSLTARLTLRATPLDVLVRDLSRSGARIRVAGGPLGIRDTTTLSDAIATVAKLLGRSFDAALLPDRLGSTVRRTFRPIRIGLRGCSLPDLDVGCTFTPPLTDTDATLLGVTLPPMRQRAAPKPAPLSAHSAPGSAPVAPSASPGSPTPPAPPGRPSAPPVSPARSIGPSAPRIGVKPNMPTGRSVREGASTDVDPRFPNGR